MADEPLSPTHDRNASATWVLSQLGRKCSFPAKNDLIDNMECHICHNVFLDGPEPEAAIKLSCGHICGLTCMLQWLKPLSEEPNNSCPLCRERILCHLPADYDDDENLDALDHLEPDDILNSWPVVAETLFQDLCEQLINGFDRQRTMAQWFRYQNFVVPVIQLHGAQEFDRYVRGIASVQFKKQLFDAFPLAFYRMMKHLRESGRYTNFIAPNANAISRTNSYIHRIRVSHHGLTRRLSRRGE